MRAPARRRGQVPGPVPVRLVERRLLSVRPVAAVHVQVVPGRGRGPVHPPERLRGRHVQLPAVTYAGQLAGRQPPVAARRRARQRPHRFVEQGGRRLQVGPAGHLQAGLALVRPQRRLRPRPEHPVRRARVDAGRGQPPLQGPDRRAAVARLQPDAGRVVGRGPRLVPRRRPPTVPAPPAGPRPPPRPRSAAAARRCGRPPRPRPATARPGRPGRPAGSPWRCAAWPAAG